MKRLNITIPEKIDKELSKLPNKSKFIAEAVKERLKKQKQQKLDTILKEAYKSSKEEDKNLNKEWEDITLAGWQ